MTTPVAEACETIIRQCENYATADRTSTSLSELEGYHDTLVGEVIQLAGMVRILALAMEGE